MILVVAGMVPWTGNLAVNVMWAGFDLALMIVLAYAAWAAWFRRQIMVATALGRWHPPSCDAWFGVVGSLDTSDMTITLITALGGELTLAAFFFWLARRIMLRTVEAFHQVTGAPGVPPRLRDTAVLLATTRAPVVLGTTSGRARVGPGRPARADGIAPAVTSEPGHPASRRGT